MNAAIFIDKDGTLVEDVPYNVDPDKIRLVQGMGEQLVHLHRSGYTLVVISNQPGIAMGLFPEPALQTVWKKINELLQSFGVQIDAFYYCPHLPQYKCSCRKPLPGLILKAAEDLNIDLQQSWMIGDILHDVEAGNRAGCRTILLDNGGETEWIKGPYREPLFTVHSATGIAHCILEKQNPESIGSI